MQDTVENEFYTRCTNWKRTVEKNSQNEKSDAKVIHNENGGKMEKNSYTRSYEHYPHKIDAKNRFT